MQADTWHPSDMVDRNHNGPREVGVARLSVCGGTRRASLPRLSPGIVLCRTPRSLSGPFKLPNLAIATPLYGINSRLSRHPNFAVRGAALLRDRIASRSVVGVRRRYKGCRQRKPYICWISQARELAMQMCLSLHARLFLSPTLNCNPPIIRPCPSPQHLLAHHNSIAHSN